MQKKERVLYHIHIRIICVCLVTVCFFSVDSINIAEAKKLKAKTYKEDYTIKNGAVLEGVGVGKTIIRGDIRVRDRGILRNLTIKGGNISLQSGASLTIDHVRIEGAHGTAITTRGGGTLVVRNSAIIDTEGKAFYIQKGKHIVITGTTVRGAGEEGIDIRSGVSGVISGNTIVGNAESGIEVILGNASLSITNNIITDNKASGIAAQFYTIAKNIGNVKIAHNTIARNKNYGIVCKKPSGGHSSKMYWRNSLHLTDNKIFNNGSGNITKACKGVYNIDTDAVRKAREEAEQKKREEEQRKIEEARRERERQERARVFDEMQARIDDCRRVVEMQERESAAHGWFYTFFIGTKSEYIKAVRAQKDKLEDIRKRLETMKDQDLDPTEHARLNALLEKMESTQKTIDAYITEKECSGVYHAIMCFLNVGATEKIDVNKKQP